NEDFISVTYAENMAGVQTRNTALPNEIHRPVLLSMPRPGSVAPETAIPKLKLDEVALQAFKDVSGRPGYSRRQIGRFLEKAEVVEIGVESVDQAKADYR